MELTDCTKTHSLVELIQCFLQLWPHRVWRRNNTFTLGFRPNQQLCFSKLCLVEPRLEFYSEPRATLSVNMPVGVDFDKENANFKDNKENHYYLITFSVPLFKLSHPKITQIITVLHKIKAETTSGDFTQTTFGI